MRSFWKLVLSLGVAAVKVHRWFHHFYTLIFEGIYCALVQKQPRKQKEWPFDMRQVLNFKWLRTEVIYTSLLPDSGHWPMKSSRVVFFSIVVYQFFFFFILSFAVSLVTSFFLSRKWLLHRPIPVKLDIRKLFCQVTHITTIEHRRIDLTKPFMKAMEICR